MELIWSNIKKGIHPDKEGFLKSEQYSLPENFAVAVSRPLDNDRYLVDIYSKGEVEVYVSKWSEGYQSQHAINLSAKTWKSTNLKSYILSSLVRKADSIADCYYSSVELQKSDILVLCSRSVTDHNQNWPLPEYRGGSLETYSKVALEQSRQSNKSIIVHRVR